MFPAPGSQVSGAKMPPNQACFYSTSKSHACQGSKQARREILLTFFAASFPPFVSELFASFSLHL